MEISGTCTVKPHYSDNLKDWRSVPLIEGCHLHGGWSISITISEKCLTLILNLIAKVLVIIGMPLKVGYHSSLGNTIIIHNALTLRKEDAAQNGDPHEDCSQHVGTLVEPVVYGTVGWPGLDYTIEHRGKICWEMRLHVQGPDGIQPVQGGGYISGYSGSTW